MKYIYNVVNDNEYILQTTNYAIATAVAINNNADIHIYELKEVRKSHFEQPKK